MLTVPCAGPVTTLYAAIVAGTGRKQPAENMSHESLSRALTVGPTTVPESATSTALPTPVDPLAGAAVAPGTVTGIVIVLSEVSLSAMAPSGLTVIRIV